ncbi:hypothetical protein V1504DRAFT_452802 [Lipomyces starkeyi]
MSSIYASGTILWQKGVKQYTFSCPSAVRSGEGAWPIQPTAPSSTMSIVHSTTELRTLFYFDATSRIISCITIQFLMLQNISYNHPIGPKKSY